MKICPRCGAELRLAARFCPRCGAPQPAEEPPPTYSMAPQETLPDTPPYQGGYYPPAAATQVQSPPVSSLRRINPWLAAGIGGVVLLCLIATAYFMITRLPGFLVDQEKKQVRRLIEEGVGVISTDIGTTLPQMITQVGTALQPLQTTLPALASSEPMQTLSNLPTQLGFAIPTGGLESLLNPETPTPGTLTMEWYNNSETYLVQIENGKVVSGTGRTNLSWTTEEGSLDGDILIVVWETTQRTDCLAKMTQTYRVEAQQLELIQSLDGCGELTTYNDRFYPRRQ
jgi:hypothetical protein